MRRRAFPWLLLAPSLLLLAAFTYLPIVRVAWESLHDKPHGTRESLFVGLGNYAALFSDKAFTQSVVNNLVYAVGTVPPSMVLALLFALAVQRSTRLNAVLRALLLLPVAGAAGRGGLAVLLHLPARRRPARLLPRQDRRARPRTGWATPTWRCGR